MLLLLTYVDLRLAGKRLAYRTECYRRAMPRTTERHAGEVVTARPSPRRR